MYNINTHILKLMLTFKFIPIGQYYRIPVKSQLQCASGSSTLNV